MRNFGPSSGMVSKARGLLVNFARQEPTLTKVKIHLALPLNLAPYRASKPDITVRHDYKARAKASDQRFPGI
jgi:hypothetical protein